MAILPKWIDWRERAAVRVSTTASLTFSTSLTYIERASGSFVADGWEVGMRCVVAGTSSNDRIYEDVTNVTELKLSVGAQDANEGPVSATLTGFHVDPDGVPEYPGAFASSNLVNSGGFTGLSGAIDGVPYEGVEYEITCNSGAADSTKGDDLFDWYLSQRTDVAASQFLSLTQKASTATQSFSGSVLLNHTSLATTKLGIAANSITAEAFIRLLRHTALYVRRRSDGAIQWVPLLETMMPK